MKCGQVGQRPPARAAAAAGFLTRRRWFPRDHQVGAVSPALSRMMVTRVLSAAIAACCASGASAELWEQWKAEHGKAYSSQDVEASRRGVFLQNLEHFAERSRFDTAAYGPDMWSDLTLAEFKAQQAGCFTEEGMEAIPTAALPLLPLDADGKPPSVDWRDPTKNSEKVNAVTPPKNQGAYGYCWAFGAAGSLEGMNVVQQKNPLQSLSEQELVDCCHACWGHGPNMAWNFFINSTHGYDSTEASYPYNLHSRHGDNNETCAISSGKTVNGTTLVKGTAHIGSYVSASADKTTNNTDNILAALVKYGPGNIGVDATCLFGYKGGVISNCTGKSVDHATLVVGAGYDASLAANPPNPAGAMPYWIVVSRPHSSIYTTRLGQCTHAGSLYIVQKQTWF